MHCIFSNQRTFLIKRNQVAISKIINFVKVATCINQGIEIVQFICIILTMFNTQLHCFIFKPNDYSRFFSGTLTIVRCETFIQFFFLYFPVSSLFPSLNLLAVFNVNFIFLMSAYLFSYLKHSVLFLPWWQLWLRCA